MKKSVVIVIPAKDYNETEFNTVKNKLSSAGVNLFIASDAYGLCTGSNGSKTKADVHLYNLNSSNFDAIVIIGGKGILDYKGNSLLLSRIKDFYNKKKITASICAAGLLIAESGIAKDGFITGYPEIKNEISKHGVNFVDEEVVVHKNIITAQGPSAADDFASAILSNLN